MMTDQYEKLLKDLDTRMEALASERDKLVDFIDTAKSLKEDCREALDDLIRARDAISRLV